MIDSLKGIGMIQVFGRVRSRTFRVVWLLEELGIEYDLKEVAPRSDEVKKFYKNGKIPFILDNETLISDSVAILAYLSDKYQTFTEIPGTIKRAKQDAITFRIIDEFDSLLWVAAKHTYVFSDEKKIPAVIDILRWEFNSNQEKFITEFSLEKYLCGEEFLIPDIILGHCLNWAESLDFPVCDTLIEYLGRLKKRAPYQKTYSLR